MPAPKKTPGARPLSPARRPSPAPNPAAPLASLAEKALAVARAAPPPTKAGKADYDALEPAVAELVRRGYEVKSACRFLAEQGAWTPPASARDGEAAFATFYRSMCSRVPGPRRRALRQRQNPA